MTGRVQYDPAEVGSTAFYRLLTSVVVPRPIAWVSTVSADGTDNLAPHSFFTVVSTDPPMLAFSSTGRKDTLVNVEQTREFVVCLAPEPLFERINASATEFSHGDSEFDRIGVTREPSLRVRPPRVGESPVALECVLHATVGLGDSTLVVGRVVHAAVAAGALREGRPAVDLLAPLARLGGSQWATIGEVRSIKRISRAQWETDPPAALDGDPV